MSAAEHAARMLVMASDNLALCEVQQPLSSHLWQCGAIHPLVRLRFVQLCNPARCANIASLAPTDVKPYNTHYNFAFCARHAQNPPSPEIVPTRIMAASRKQCDGQLVARSRWWQPHSSIVRQQRQQCGSAAAVTAMYLAALNLHIRRHTFPPATSWEHPIAVPNHPWRGAPLIAAGLVAA